MGTAQVQGEIWGAKAADWAAVQEPAWRTIYEHVLRQAAVRAGARVLDVGCGAGGALVVAHELGAQVSGLDASANLVGIARGRLPGARIEVGEMEALPFADGEFDLVTGFNSFQFAGDVVQALREARRVLRPGGSVAVLVWGRREDCELQTGILPGVMALLPPPPPGAPTPFSLSDAGSAEHALREAGFGTATSGEVDCLLAYPDAATALRAMGSAAPFVRAERLAGTEAVRAAVLGVLTRFTATDGSVLIRNRVRYFVAQRAG